MRNDVEILRGLTIPKQSKGRPTKEAQEQWLELVEIVMSRGAKTCRELVRLLGLDSRTAKRYHNLVCDKWAEAYDVSRVNLRREQLYREAELASQVAWEVVNEGQLEDDNKMVIDGLKAILAANKRKATLSGLDTIQIKAEIKHEANSTTTVNVVHSVEDSFGLEAGALEMLGTNLAKLMNPATADEAKVIDITPDAVEIIE